MNPTPFQEWFNQQGYRALEDSYDTTQAAWNAALDAASSLCKEKVSVMAVSGGVVIKHKLSSPQHCSEAILSLKSEPQPDRP